MDLKQVIGLATTGALAVFAARAASSFVGGPGTIKGLAAELAGAVVGVFVASKLK